MVHAVPATETEAGDETRRLDLYCFHRVVE